MAIGLALVWAGVAIAADPLRIDSHRELFVDDYLIDHLDGVALELQHPVERDVVIVHDEPWEGNTSTYHTIFRDGDFYRMYYRGGHYDESADKPAHEDVSCYAESSDGVHWVKPKLNLVEFKGSRENNIILVGSGSHNLAPFRDSNPGCAADLKYKAVGSGQGGLLAFKSVDGIHWSPMSDQPVITEGAFDSLNVAFWDADRGYYVDFHRDFRDGVRDIKTCTSQDFIHWSDPDWIQCVGAPPQHLYTNAIGAYQRAPHLYVGLPMRFVPDRNPEQHTNTGVSDCVLMTSRDGQLFRRWNEAFIRPGPQPDRWVTRNNLPASGLVLTEPDVPGGPQEISMYTTEGYYRGKGTRLRRHTLRLDGFVSVSAPPSGGEMITKPLTFSAASDDVTLFVNFATSAVGALKCELQDVHGQPIAGFSVEECVELFGDRVDQPVSWSSSAKLSSLAGIPIRLRFVMRDADLFAVQFRPTETR